MKSLLILVTFFISAHAFAGQEPVALEVTTKYTSVSEALQATKKALLMQSFIIEGTIQETSFTAKRTTNAQADYYVADVTATLKDGAVVITITFIKVGTGLLKLQKVADAIKTELEK